MADFLAPGASLLIRNQIICIDDIERAGQGLYGICGECGEAAGG